MGDHVLGGTNVEGGVVEAERAGTVGAQSGAEEAGAEQEDNGANPG